MTRNPAVPRFLAAVVLVATACSDGRSGPAAGTAGGPCFPDDTCDPGLECGPAGLCRAPDGPCAGVTCTGHGTCTVVGDLASCACEVGYHAVGLACAEDHASGCPGIDPLVEPAAQLVVAPDGDDAAAGTIEAPLRTLAEAASRFPGGGTVVVRGGTYPDQPWMDARGTADTPLVIRAATGEVPVFDGSAVTDAWSAVIHLGAAEHVVVAGLEIRSCTAPSCQGIDAGRVLDLTVRECHLHHLDGPGMRFTGQGIRLEANHVHDVALTNVDNAAYPDGGWPTCLGTTPDRDTPSAPHATDVVIRLNRIVDCWGEGIGVWFARSAVIEHNVVDNAWNVGIYLDNSPDVSVTRNVIRMTRGMHDGAGTAILMGSEPYVDWGLQGAASEGIVIVNNVAIGGGGIGWWSSADVTDANTYARVSILHNTVVATLRGALGFDAVDAGRPAPSDVIARNNVFLEAEPSWIGDADLWALGGNAWVDAPLPDLAGGSDVALALAAGEISWVEDARALAAQVGEGEAGTGVTQDLGCAWRDESAPTRGAFEF